MSCEAFSFEHVEPRNWSLPARGGLRRRTRRTRGTRGTRLRRSILSRRDVKVGQAVVLTKTLIQEYICIRNYRITLIDTYT